MGNARAVRYSPCRRANSTAAAHISSGSGVRRGWLVRHSSSRARNSRNSSPIGALFWGIPEVTIQGQPKSRTLAANSHYLQRWIDQLRWQRLKPFQELAEMLLDHLDGILNYCRIKVPLGVVEAVNGNIKSLLRRGRGYKNLRICCWKAQRLAATRTEFMVFKKAA